MTRKELIEDVMFRAALAMDEAGLTTAEKRQCVGRLLITQFSWFRAGNESMAAVETFSNVYDMLLVPETPAELRHRQGDDRDEDPTEPAVEAAE